MRSQSFLFLSAALALVLTTSSVYAATELPPFSDVEQLVKKHFAPTYKFKEGDLITKSDVSPFLAQLPSIGWHLPKPERILDRVLDDNDYLVRQLKSPKGRQLFQRTAKYPGALDRLDRMREMHGGNKTLDVFVQKTPGNADVLTTILTTKRGQRFANDIAKYNNGKDFNEPTERIYRVQELVPALKQIYDEQLEELKRKPRR